MHGVISCFLVGLHHHSPHKCIWKLKSVCIWNTEHSLYLLKYWNNYWKLRNIFLCSFKILLWRTILISVFFSFFGFGMQPCWFIYTKQFSPIVPKRISNYSSLFLNFRIISLYPWQSFRAETGNTWWGYLIKITRDLFLAHFNYIVLNSFLNIYGAREIRAWWDD